MAANKEKKQTPAVDIPECPVCHEPMKSPIFLCESGHSMCTDCTNIFSPPKCPICRHPMTHTRNRAMEELTKKVNCRLSTAKVSCPNRAVGCVYVFASSDVADHVKECIFRQMECPLGTVFGKCSWTGKLHQMMDHCRKKHPSACGAGLKANADVKLENVSLCSLLQMNTQEEDGKQHQMIDYCKKKHLSACDVRPKAVADVELENVTLRECDRRLFLAAQHELLFIITVKIDTIQRLAYWTVQQIGPKKQANQHIYEIHVNSKRDPKRNVIFTEHCFSDTVKVEEIIHQSNCAVLPLDILAQFIKDDKLSFRYLIRRVSEKPKPYENVAANSNNANARSVSCSRRPGPGPQGPRPKGPWQKRPRSNGPGPKRPEPERPGPKGPGPNGPSPKGPEPNEAEPKGPEPKGPEPTGPEPNRPRPKGPGPKDPGPKDPGAD